MNPTPILETTLNNTRIFVYDELFDSDLIPTNSLNIYLLDFKTDSYCQDLDVAAAILKLIQVLAYLISLSSYILHLNILTQKLLYD